MYMGIVMMAMGGSGGGDDEYGDCYDGNGGC